MEITMSSVEFISELIAHENKVKNYGMYFKASQDSELYFKDTKVLHPSQEVKNIFSFLTALVDKAYYRGREDGAKAKSKELRSVLRIENIT